MENKKPMIYVGTPHNDRIPWQYLKSFANTLVFMCDRYDIGLTLAESALVHVNRNEIIKNSAKDKVDYLLMVDSDMVWNHEQVERLLSYDKDVVSGLYLSRNALAGVAHLPLVMRKATNGRYGTMTLKDIPPTLFKCDAAGAGFMLLKGRVLEKMVELTPKIGFPFDYITIKEMGVEENDKTGLVGEDICFCSRLQKAGFDIWCDPTVRVGHLTSEAV